MHDQSQSSAIDYKYEYGKSEFDSNFLRAKSYCNQPTVKLNPSKKE